ncbi:pH-dependent sodium/proton antiporter [Actinobacillus pleuropneumoniae]|nr:pH-dependent sodium/proton antiporter [Actinobacillus pleuropneumoniae]
MLGIAKVPEGINLKQIFAIAVLCGIGFTMSMFIAGLAFGEEEASENMLALARLGILMGTFVSAIIGYFLLKITTKPSLMKAA